MNPIQNAPFYTSNSSEHPELKRDVARLSLYKPKNIHFLRLSNLLVGPESQNINYAKQHLKLGHIGVCLWKTTASFKQNLKTIKIYVESQV